MAGVYERASDEARGKAGKFTCWWIGEDGKKKTCVGTTDRKESERIARDKDYQARQVRLGLVDPAERQRRESAARPLGEHLRDYRAYLQSKGDDPKHVQNTASAIDRLFDLANIEHAVDITPDRVQGAIGRMRAAGPDGKRGRSARTCNHALRAVKSFARWLADTGRIRDYPRGLRAMEPIPIESDRRRVRRPLSADELARLIAATEAAPTVTVHGGGINRFSPVTATLSGPDRAMAYRIAMATGFRAQEIRTLTPERFNLDGPEPTIIVLACYSKRGKRSGRDDVQPISREMAAILKAWIADKPQGSILFPLPADRTAKVLAEDLVRAGIAPRDTAGRVIDFHALRHSYVTDLVRAGINPKHVQKLARHSSITLTLDLYTTLDDAEIRAAIERPRTTNAPSPGDQS